MSFDWKKQALSEVASIISGGTPSTKNEDFYGGDIAWITPKDLSQHNKMYISKGERSITQLGLDFSSARLLPKDTVLMSSRAPIGYIAIAANELCTNQGFKSLILKEDQHPEFYYYLLKNNISLFESRATGTTFKEISGKIFQETELSIPNFKTQQKVAKILGDLDRKIEKNNQINETLEAMAQAIFKSWFVDFDPVKAKVSAREAGLDSDAINRAAMSVIASKTDAELDEMQAESPAEYASLQTTASHFPDELVESELGMIPKGWRSCYFGEALSHTIGGNWGSEHPEDVQNVKVKILRGTDLPEVYKGNDRGVPTRYLDPKRLKNRQLKVGDIVIEISGGSKDQPTGRSLFITQEILDRLHGVVAPTSFCRLFRPVNIKEGLILGLHLQLIYQEGKTWGYQNQSTGISNFQTKVFLENEVIIFPDINIMNDFYNIVMPLITKMGKSENQSLIELRDSLLPKLLSGEIEV